MILWLTLRQPSDRRPSATIIECHDARQSVFRRGLGRKARGILNTCTKHNSAGKGARFVRKIRLDWYGDSRHSCQHGTPAGTGCCPRACP
jgi:hypothetical protein